MPEFVHVHAPPELSETSRAQARHEWLLELTAVILLSVATVCIAWSGYQAARWSGIQARRYAQATTARSLANRSATRAGQDRLQDLLNFNRWLEVSTDGNQELADLYVRRFREEFRPAFDAWIAQDPLNTPDAIASPLLMPQYKPAGFAKADALERVADHHFEEGRDATEHADAYIFATVFFAAVLFFAGISLRFGAASMRVTILVLASAFLVFGIVRLITLPKA